MSTATLHTVNGKQYTNEQLLAHTYEALEIVANMEDEQEVQEQEAEGDLE